MQIKPRIVAIEFKSDSARSVRKGSSLGGVKAIKSIAASPKQTFSIMLIDVSRAYFHATAQRLVLVRLPAEDNKGADAGEICWLNWSMYGTWDTASNWERDWQEHIKS